MLEELLPAQNKSYELGLKLKLPQYVVEAIHSKELPPEKYLLKVLIKFLHQVEPTPTWRVIIEALRSPAVNLPVLGRKVEAAHFSVSRAVPCGKMHQSGGGYDCQFVTPPPDMCQTECPICLSIPKEPCIISCPCSKDFCRECIERIKKDNRPCPLCNMPDFTFFRNYGSERFLKAQEVWCWYKGEKNGCKWRGKLGEYEQHLNRNPFPGEQLAGCRFVEVECKHGCGEWFQRRHIISHQNHECPKRPYSCEYCCKYSSTFEEVTENHYHQCSNFPILCPNKCQTTPFERQKIEKHVKVECPLAQINCPLQYAGCDVKLPRKAMPEHMKDTVTHMTLLATVTQKLLLENQELRGNIEKLKKDNRQLQAQMSSTEAHYLVLEKLTEKQFHELRYIKKEVETLNNQRELFLGSFPIDFHVNYAIKNVQYMSPFNTHSLGYRMCIEVHTNGDGDGKGTHLSIFTCLMRGLFDDYLKWPFRGDITIQIINQAGDHSHVEKVITYNEITPDIIACRVN